MPTPTPARVYNPKLVVASANGQEIVGPGDTDFVSIEWNADLATPVAGLDGGLNIDIINDTTALVTVTLMKGSRGSVLLDGFRRLLEQGESGAFFAFACRYIPTGETWTAKTAWVQSRPPVVFGASSGTEEWAIGVAQVEGDRFELPSTA